METVPWLFKDQQALPKATVTGADKEWEHKRQKKKKRRKIEAPGKGGDNQGNW